MVGGPRLVRERSCVIRNLHSARATWPAWPVIRSRIARPPGGIPSFGAWTDVNENGANGHLSSRARQAGDLSCAARAELFIPQWCFPIRRQHAGRRDSSWLRGTLSQGNVCSPKTANNKMESARLTSQVSRTGQAASGRRLCIVRPALCPSGHFIGFAGLSSWKPIYVPGSRSRSFINIFKLCPDSLSKSYPVHRGRCQGLSLARRGPRRGETCAEGVP